MAGISYTFNGQLFEIKGIGLTAEQLKAIGDQQAATGSLIGLRPGDVLSAATQAQAGLQSAQAQVGQALSGVTGALGAGIPGATGILGSVSKSLASVGGALSGSLSAGVAGLTGAIGPAVSGIVNRLQNTLLSGGATGAGGSITSLATTAIGTLNKAISGGIPTGSPINTADFVKQIPALGSVGSLTPPDVTGLLAQTKNLVGQAASKLSNFKGVGSFGLDVPQLETAGILKPGTSALQAATGASLRDMLKSASAFTGKLGIKSAEALLANAPAQAQIQQQLMVKGLAGAAALGIPTGILSGPALGAVSVLAAKSVSNAVAWLKGAPAAAGVPSSAATAAAAIAPGVTNADVARMSAYSVNLTKEKVPEVFKAQVTPTPAVDTCNRATVTACTDGQLDPKIPAPQFTKTDNDPVTGSKRDAITAGFDAALTALETSNKQFENVLANLQVLENQQVITQQQFDSIATEWKAAAAYGDNARKTIIDPAFALYESAVSSYSPGISERAVGLLGIRNNTSPVRIQFYQLTSAINSEQRVQLIRATGLQTRIKELKKRISTNVS
jgi:hypothetical protein